MGERRPETMQEKILLPNLPRQNITGDGPRFQDEIFKKINKAKASGWRQTIKNLITSHKQIPVVLLLSVVIASAFVFTNQNTSVNNQTSTASHELTSENSITNDTSPIILVVTSNSTTVAAVAGSGVTHLARTAVKQHIETNNIALSAEQVVYAEDYLQNLTGNYDLEIGQEIDFSTTDIQTAVSNAQNLTQWQIENLSKYVN